MELLVALIVAFVVLAGLLYRSRRQAALERGGTVAYERRHLFTKTERAFLGALDGATTDQVRSFAKVPLAELLSVPAAVPEAERRGAARGIDRQHVDFVLCDPADLRVLAVVELEDPGRPGHGPKERQDGVDRALASAGIPVIRFPARPTYTVDEVRNKLAPVMPAVPPPAPSARRAKAGKGKGRSRDATGARAAVVAVEPAVVPRDQPEVAAPAPASAPPKEEAPTPAPEPVVPPIAATVKDTSRAPAPGPSAAVPASTSTGSAPTVNVERDRYARLGTCPTCGKPMVERVGKRGAMKGKTYLVCSGEPPCAPLASEA